MSINTNKKFNQPLFIVLFLLTALFYAAPTIDAQSPNTASVIIVTADQNGAVVPGAKVTISNNATGAVRDVVTGEDGTVTVPALELTGTYKVTVSKDGFGNEERDDITLRSGETATLKVATFRRFGQNGSYGFRNNGRCSRRLANR